MTQHKVVLVTGVANDWGASVAARLLAEIDEDGTSAHRVIGLDSDLPKEEVEGLDFIQADVRNPLLVELLKTEAVQTVCHLVFSERVRPSEAVFDLNVMGTMKLLGACAESGVQKVVLKSSTMVYGAHPSNPAFMTEQSPLKGSRAYGYTRDMVEIEAFCNGFTQQVPEMLLTLLRFPSIIGPTCDTPMTRFLKEPRAPVLLGFDPLMQIIHEDDVVEAIIHAVANDMPGVYNVAADGILPLSRLLALAAKFPIPVFHLCAYWGAGFMKNIGAQTSKYMPIELDYIRYPWVGDLTKMRQDFGFEPVYTAEEALREFAGEQRVRRYMPGTSTLAYDEERLRDTLERRRRERERAAGQSGEEALGENNE